MEAQKLGYWGTEGMSAERERGGGGWHALKLLGWIKFNETKSSVFRSPEFLVFLFLLLSSLPPAQSNSFSALSPLFELRCFALLPSTSGNFSQALQSSSEGSLDPSLSDCGSIVIVSVVGMLFSFKIGLKTRRRSFACLIKCWLMNSAASLKGSSIIWSFAIKVFLIKSSSLFDNWYPTRLHKVINAFKEKEK